MCVVLLALCNHPKALASHFNYDQSNCLFVNLLSTSSDSQMLLHTVHYLDNLWHSLKKINTKYSASVSSDSIGAIEMLYYYYIIIIIF